MSRRSRQDVFPQILTVSTNDVGAVDDYIVQQFSLPVNRVVTGRAGRAQVIELLWVDYFPGMRNVADTTSTTVAYLTSGSLRTNSDTCTVITIAEDVSHPLTIAPVVINRSFTTSGAASTVYPIRVNLTDTAGNGTLVATSRLDLVFGDVDGAAVSACTAKICYRIVTVGVTEYVGIVQSQSNVVLS